MTTHRPPHVEQHPKPHLIDKGVIETHPVVLRQAVTTARQVGANPPPHPSVWAPWGPVAAQAEAEFKAEIATALKLLQHRTGDASKVLDTAEAMAAEQAGTLRAAAWAAWHRYMDAADRTAAAIMGPAADGYQREIAAATAAYEAQLAQAESTYAAVLADVNRAKTDASGIAATA